MECPTCGTENNHNGWFCTKCKYNMYGVTAEPVKEKRRRPMTNWEKLKLGFYRSEKKWIENIKDRHRVKDRDGKTIVVSQGQAIPPSPSYLWPTPKGAHK